VSLIEAYLKSVKLYRDYTDEQQDPLYSEVIDI